MKLYHIHFIRTTCTPAFLPLVFDKTHFTNNSLPGTSKWNKIEHRLFCYITKSWQGQPLVDIETVVNLIAGTTTEKGLKVKCQVDTKKYELKRKVTDEEFEKIQLFPCDILGSWNYVIKPRKQ